MRKLPYGIKAGSGTNKKPFELSFGLPDRDVMARLHWIWKERARQTPRTLGVFFIVADAVYRFNRRGKLEFIRLTDKANRDTLEFYRKEVLMDLVELMQPDMDE